MVVYRLLYLWTVGGWLSPQNCNGADVWTRFNLVAGCKSPWKECGRTRRETRLVVGNVALVKIVLCDHRIPRVAPYSLLLQCSCRWTDIKTHIVTMYILASSGQLLQSNVGHHQLQRTKQGTGINLLTQDGHTKYTANGQGRGKSAFYFATYDYISSPKLWSLLLLTSWWDTCVVQRPRPLEKKRVKH